MDADNHYRDNMRTDVKWMNQKQSEKADSLLELLFPEKTIDKAGESQYQKETGSDGVKFPFLRRSLPHFWRFGVADNESNDEVQSN